MYNSIIISSLLILTLYSCKQSDPIETEYKLIWSDEFDGSTLDENKWDIQTGDGSQYGLWGWGNAEKQWYQKENIQLWKGTLLIGAVQEKSNGYDYTSARIRTLNKFDFKYGRVEASIRMSNVGGLWHALWMLPSNPEKGWPISGEIDIMEYLGNAPTEILNYAHYSVNSTGTQGSSGTSTVFEEDSDFHQYALEWDENKISWFRDSVETYRMLKNQENIYGSPFDAQFHLLLNTAVGGNLGGDIDDSRLNKPRFMEVDYIRVYQTSSNN